LKNELETKIDDERCEMSMGYWDINSEEQTFLTDLRNRSIRILAGNPNRRKDRTHILGGYAETKA